MSGENKNHAETKSLLNIFTENWNEDFLIDPLNKRSLSYGDFYSEIISGKEQLERMGFKKNDIICSVVNNSAELLIFYFSCLLHGITVVPIDPTNGREEIEDIISQINYKAIFSEKVLDGRNVLSFKEFISHLFDNKKRGIGEHILESADFEREFIITFTSGSTGKPKGVIHSLNNLVHTAIEFKKVFGFGKENIFYHNLSMTYMAGILNCFILPLVSGSKIVIGERFSVSKIINFWKIPIENNVNTFWFIPTVINLLLKFDRGDEGISLGRNKQIIGCVGTAPLGSKARIEFEKKYNIPLYESYGLSETLFVTTNAPGTAQDNSVGKPLGGVALDFGQDNEILINVPWMFLGYSNTKTKNFFKNSKYLSGDLGSVDSKGFLSITGRKKDIIIRGGINISPKRIEEFLRQFKVFHETVVLGFEDPNIGEKIVCFYTTYGGDYSVKTQLVNCKITENLGKNYNIDVFVMLGSIPKNINGKVDKEKIREMYKELKDDN